MQAFNTQLHEFCQLMLSELVHRAGQMPPRPVEPSQARDFAESLLLCPTLESARHCIQRDFDGALHFVLALNLLNDALPAGRFQIPSEWPKYQTRFYVLGSVVHDYILSLSSEPPSGLELESLGGLDRHVDQGAGIKPQD